MCYDKQRLHRHTWQWLTRNSVRYEDQTLHKQSVVQMRCGFTKDYRPSFQLFILTSHIEVGQTSQSRIISALHTIIKSQEEGLKELLHSRATLLQIYHLTSTQAYMSSISDWRSRDNNFLLVIAGEAKFLTHWSLFKDEIRQVIKEQPGWVDVSKSEILRKGENRGWCSLSDRDDALTTYGR